MIKPTVGRVVWFYHYNPTSGILSHTGPLAALIAKVHSDRVVNLMVIGESGSPSPEASVPLMQENEEVPQSSYCTWMPYQVGQAAKTEQLEKKLASKGA